MPTVLKTPAQYISGSDLETIDVLGSSVQFIPLPSEVSERFCLLRGTDSGGRAAPSPCTATAVTRLSLSFPARSKPSWLTATNRSGCR